MQDPLKSLTEAMLRKSRAQVQRPSVEELSFEVPRHFAEKNVFRHRVAAMLRFVETNGNDFYVSYSLNS